MDDRIERRLANIEKRLSLLEGCGLNEEDYATIKMDLILPEADIDGLHFNKTVVSAVFERQDNGWYHSRDILFLSARNVKDDNSYDTLTKYLNSYDFLTCIRRQLPEEIFGEVMTPDKIEVSLPKKNKGVKKYNGVEYWYWLNDPVSPNFFSRFYPGYFSNHLRYSSAFTLGGVAILFRVIT
jgi:hypothetical protein